MQSENSLSLHKVYFELNIPWKEIRTKYKLKTKKRRG